MIQKITVLLVILFWGNLNVQSQVVQITKTDTESIIIPENECTKNSIFIFVKEDSNNKITNSFLESIRILSLLNQLDTTNFIIYLIEIKSKTLSCSLKSFSIDDYELPSYFSYDPYYIIIHPRKTFQNLMVLRFDSLASIGNFIPNIQSRNSPFINIKDLNNLIKLVRCSSELELIGQMQSEIIKLKKELLNVKGKIDSIHLAKKNLKGTY